MRIGIEVSAITGQRTGIGHYVTRWLEALLECDRTDLMLYSNVALDRSGYRLRGATLVPGHLRFNRWLWMQTVLPSAVRRTRPDLCHFTNGIAPLRLSRPYVLTIHDVSALLHPALHPASRRTSLRLVLPQMARRAIAVVTVSNVSRLDISETLQVQPEKIHVVEGAAPEGFAPVSDPVARYELRRKYALPERFLLHVGTLEPRKNLPRLVAAVASIRRMGYDYELVLVGPRGWLMQSFDDEVARLRMTESVRVLGYVPTQDLPGLLSLATLLVYPSLYEGFGLPAVEAMACGAPIVTSVGTAPAEVCGDAAVLVDPTEVESIARGIVELLSDPARRASLRARGLARAAQFSWRAGAERTIDLYERLVREGEAGGP